MKQLCHGNLGPSSAIKSQDTRVVCRKEIMIRGPYTGGGAGVWGVAQKVKKLSFRFDKNWGLPQQGPLLKSVP